MARRLTSATVATASVGLAAVARAATDGDDAMRGATGEDVLVDGNGDDVTAQGLDTKPLSGAFTK